MPNRNPPTEQSPLAPDWKCHVGMPYITYHELNGLATTLRHRYAPTEYPLNGQLMRVVPASSPPALLRRSNTRAPRQTQHNTSLRTHTTRANMCKVLAEVPFARAESRYSLTTARTSDSEDKRQRGGRGARLSAPSGRPQQHGPRKCSSFSHLPPRN